MGFHTSYRQNAYVTQVPQRVVQKRFFVFWVKIQFQSTKVCYKVSLCENFQRQSCSITIPPYNGPQILARNVTLQPKIQPQSDPPLKIILQSYTYSHKITVLEHASRGLSAIAELLVKLGRHDNVARTMTVLALPVFDILLCKRKYRFQFTLL